MRFLTFLVVVALLYVFFVRPKSRQAKGEQPLPGVSSVQPAASAAATPRESTFVKRPFDRAHEAIDAAARSRSE
ncbi:MAG: hypothetical protein WCP06_08830 [Verrucomicrobiota bacterium]